MDERLAIVFEVYRYAVCWLCLALFLILGFFLLMVVFGGSNATIAFLSAQSGGLLLCMALFLIHWRMKNPHL